MTTTNLKKDLQKTVKNFRDALPDITTWDGRNVRPDYPKAMLTGQQMAKRTATVNFGHNSEKNHNKLSDFANSEAFKAFCEKYNVKVGQKEINADNRVQIRMYF